MSENILLGWKLDYWNEWSDGEPNEEGSEEGHP